MKAQIKIEKNRSASIRYFALLLLLSTMVGLNCTYGQSYGQGNRQGNGNGNGYGNGQGRTPARPASGSGNYNSNRQSNYPDDRYNARDSYDDEYDDRDMRQNNNNNRTRNGDRDYRNDNQNYRNGNGNGNGNSNPNNRNGYRDGNYRDNDVDYRNNDPNNRNNPQNNNARRPDAKTATAKKDSIEKAQKDSVKQSFCKHEFSFWGSGGLSTLSYKPNIGDKTNLLGGNVGMGYTYFFSQNWGLLLGIEGACYNAKITIANFQDRYATLDADNDQIVYNATVRHYSERHHLVNVNIPLLVQYQTSILGNDQNLFFNLGFKLGIPVWSKYDSKAELQASGTYVEYNQTLYDQIDLGYGDSFLGEENTGKFDFKLSYTVAAEAGVKWSLGRRFSLYTGIYFDYTFNDIVKTHDNSFIEYNNLYPQNFTCNNSVLTSRYVKDPTNPANIRTPIVKNKVSPLSAGLKLRLGINMCKPPAKEKAEKEKEKKKENEKLEESLNKKKRPKVVLDAEDDDMRRLNDEYGPVKDMSVLYVESYSINESKLSPVMKMMLDKRIESLKKYNNDRYQIICEGHACDIGTREANLNIGQARANTVRKYLISKGFKSKNVVAITKGDTSPVVPNDSEMNRRINRRVVFVILEK